MNFSVGNQNASFIILFLSESVMCLEFPHRSFFFRNSDDLDESVDFLISLGGDGTLLDTIAFVRDKDIPVIGINFGRLGFLASIGKGDMLTAVEALANRTYVADKRSLIHLDASKPLLGEVPYGLNEFAIHKTDTSPMIKIHTYLNGEFLNAIGPTVDRFNTYRIYRIFTELWWTGGFS